MIPALACRHEPGTGRTGNEVASNGVHQTPVSRVQPRVLITRKSLMFVLANRNEQLLSCDVAEYVGGPLTSTGWPTTAEPIVTPAWGSVRNGKGDSLDGTIALEEHFAIPDTLQDSAAFVPERYWTILRERLLDVADGRLREMDDNGVEMMVLSLNAPAVQAIHDPDRAIQVAKRANDSAADAVARRPDRFQAFAALPMQDPDAATKELVRCVKELGFRGALVNGFSQVGDPESIVYCDDPRYAAFWETLETLDVPFYLHPRNPLTSWAHIYAGHEWLLGPTWAFGQETAVHALRLMGAGLFDRHPRLQIILGHLGEGLPISMWRIDNRNAWVQGSRGHTARHPIAYYFHRNVHLTTSGNFRTQSLIDAILEIGSDRIMFSTDWPFENVEHAAKWFDAAAISENDRLKIGRTNAVKLLKLALSREEIGDRM